MRKSSVFSLLAAFSLVLGGVGYADSAKAQSGAETGPSVFAIAAIGAGALLVGILAATGGDDDDSPVSA